MVDSKAPALYHMKWIKTNNGEQVQKAVLPTRKSGPRGTEQGWPHEFGINAGILEACWGTWSQVGSRRRECSPPQGRIYVMVGEYSKAGSMLLWKGVFQDGIYATV